ncbi:MAG: V-type ATP synthase subunit E [Clostridia bacterium]|nr:V-type ATP synthase subunit E [Clostridia bacterium]
MILNKIREYGDQTAEKLIDESTRKSKELTDEARSEVSAYIESEEKSLGDEIARIEAQAETDYAATKRDRTLALKQEMISKAYDRAAVVLGGISDDDKLRLYRKWLKMYGENSDYSVVLNKHDRDSFGDILASEMSRGEFPGHPSLSAFAAEISGGMILDFGDSRNDISFESVVNNERGRFDGELVDILFAEG